MSTYAGYQKYEVPNLGAVAASAIDKMTERDEKQELLDKQLKYKQDLAAAKDAKKLAEDEKKQTESEGKALDTDIEKITKEAAEFPQLAAADQATAATNLGTSIKDELAPYVGTKDREKIKEGKAKASKYAYTIHKGKEYFTQLAGSMDKVKAADSPYLTQLYSDALVMNDPDDMNRVEYTPDESGNLIMKLYKPDIVEKDGKLEKEFKVVSEVPITSFSNVLGEVNTPSMNFDKEEQNVLTYGGKIENAQGNVVQANSKEYQKERDAYAKRIANGSNPRSTYDGVYHYITNKHVIAVNENTSQEAIDYQIEQSGYDKNDVFVMKYQSKDGKLIPKLDKDQKKELQQSIKSSIDGRSVKQVTKPSTKEDKKTLSDVDMNTLTLAAKGDPDALTAVLQAAMQKGNIAFADDVNKTLYGNSLPGSISVKRKSGKDPIQGLPTFDFVPIKLNGSDATITSLKNLIQ